MNLTVNFRTQYQSLSSFVTSNLIAVPPNQKKSKRFPSINQDSGGKSNVSEISGFLKLKTLLKAEGDTKKNKSQHTRERQRERDSACVCEREREAESESREIKRGKESESVCVSVYVFVCDREREVERGREREREGCLSH